MSREDFVLKGAGRRKRIAIVGSRDFPSRDLILGYVGSLRPKKDGIVIISGGARGVDTWAIEAAEIEDMSYEIFDADWEKHGKKAGFMRNLTLVQEADGVIAFWDGESKGTLHTIKAAAGAGVPCTVHVRGKNRG